MSPQAVLAPAPPAAPSLPPFNAPAYSAPKVSVQQYLDMERESEMRHEYVRGEIIEMAGETPDHNFVAGNMYLDFRLTLPQRTCKVYFEGVRLRVSPEQYRYPDVMALCGEPEFDNENPPCLLNPSVLAEVLSPSTQTIDRGDKIAEYRAIPTLTDYVIVAQDRIFVEHYVRQNSGQWMRTEYSQLDEALVFAGLGVTMTLRQIYRETPLADAAERSITSA